MKVSFLGFWMELNNLTRYDDNLLRSVQTMAELPILTLHHIDVSV